MSTQKSVDGEFLDYRIEERIGQGGMGVVYGAHDRRLKRKVALKLMAPELALDERYRARFERESELAMSLEHPNVVPIHDAGEAEGRLYLAMRCVEGTDLRALLRKEGALSPTRALSITRQIAQALDAAHAKGLVHRDVKPSNVLLDASEHVYLADFGLTRRQSEDGAQVGDARSLGTPAYLAPEQIEGGPIDGRADVYSLGCLLYECITGEPPFPAISRLEVAWAHLEEEPPRASVSNPALPAAVDDVIGKAMAKDPDERYSTCAELAEAAEVALGIGQPSGVRRRWLLAAAAALVMALTAVAVGLVARDETTPAQSSLAVRANALVRVDPTKNAIAAVVDVGRAPSETAISGDNVWVYNARPPHVAEVDARTNKLRARTALSTAPPDFGAFGKGGGPLIAADSQGVWVVGRDRRRGRSILTRIRSGHRGKHEYRFGLDLAAITVAEGAVWALGSRDTRVVVLRIDPRSGRVAERKRLATGLTGRDGMGLAVGGGYVWVTEASSGTVYRLDPRTGDTRHAKFGSFVGPPVFGFGRLWLCAWEGEHGAMLRVHPRTMKNEYARDALEAEEGRFAAGFGSLWRVDDPSGTLMRFRPRTGDPAGLVPVRAKAAAGAPFLVITSLAAGAGGVWLTVAPG